MCTICMILSPNAPVKVNPDPSPHPGIYVGISFKSLQTVTNAPQCGPGKMSGKCPTPGASEDVPDEFVIE